MAKSTKRMSPKAQMNARDALESEIKQATTGVPEIDSLTTQLVKRKHTFAGPGMPAEERKTGFIDAIKKLLGLK